MLGRSAPTWFGIKDQDGEMHHTNVMLAGMLKVKECTKRTQDRLSVPAMAKYAVRAAMPSLRPKSDVRSKLDSPCHVAVTKNDRPAPQLWTGHAPHCYVRCTDTPCSIQYQRLGHGSLACRQVISK